MINSYGPIVPYLQGAQRIIGNWNASTNTPFLQDGVGTVGDTYIVAVAGIQNLGHGLLPYNVGDQVYFTTGGIWDVIPAGNTVVSVNGQSGIVILNLADINDVIITAPQNRQAIVYNSGTQNYINSTLQPADVQLGNVPNIDASNLANDTIQTFTADNTPIVSGDTGLNIAQKSQGQINNINSILIIYGNQISILQQNSIQSINGQTGNTNFILANGLNTTVNTNSNSGTITLSVDIANATNSIIGATRSATLAEVNNNIETFAYVTPATLNNSLLASQVSTNTINITNLQNNSIQSISYSGGTFTGNIQLQFINSSTLTWNLSDSGNTTQATANANLATNSSVGVLTSDNGITGLITAGVYKVNTGSADILGVIRSDNGNTNNIDSNGILTINLATPTVYGVAKYDNSSLQLNINNQLFVRQATNLLTGIVQPNGTQILINGAGIISIAQATESLIAGLAVATQLQTNAGNLDTVTITPLKLANSTLASTVASNTINITNLQANAIQTLNGITNNNSASIRDAQGNVLIATDSGTTTIVTIANSSPTVSGLIRPGGIGLKQTTNNPLVWDAPLSQASNLLDNGGWDFWQRGNNFSITTQAKTFFADRWFIDTLTSSFVGNITIIKNTQTNNFTTQPFQPARNLAQITVNSYTSGSYYIAQGIENVNTLSNEYLTIGVVIYCSSPITIPADMVQYFGTGGSPSATVITNVGTLNYTAANTFQYVSVTIPNPLPALTGKTYGTNNNDCVAIRLQFPNTINSYYIGRIQLQSGQISTPFNVKSMALDYMNCMRYCQSITTLWSGWVVGSNVASVNKNYSVPLRTPYTQLISSVNNGNVNFAATTGITQNQPGYIVDARTGNGGLGAWGSFSSTYLVAAELTY